ncbi:MAG: WD40 repeat domain-containing protein [Crocosphaera sp.]|nr:WD40 repeat domain-containing protein [Crocosphaera sp.]
MTDFYIEQETEQHIYGRLSKINNDPIRILVKHCYILSPPHTGKSSLLKEIRGRLMNSQKFQCANICLKSSTEQEDRKNDEDKCYRGLIYDLAINFQETNGVTLCDDLSSEIRSLNGHRLLEDFLENILLPKADKNKEVIIFIDEFDILFKDDHLNHNFRISFLDSLYKCLKNRFKLNRSHDDPKITFVLLGRTFNYDKRINHSFAEKHQKIIEDINGVEIIRIGKIRTSELRLETLQLTETIVNNWTEIVARIIDWTSGHPLLTNKIVSCLEEDYQSNTQITIDAIDKIVTSKSFLEDQLVKEHFNIIKEEFLNDPKLLAVYEEILKRDGILYGIEYLDSDYEKLLNLGIIIITGNQETKEIRVDIHNKIYKQQLDQQWIDTLRREFTLQTNATVQKTQEAVEQLTNTLIILVDICFVLSSLAFRQIGWPLELLGFFFLLLALVLSVFVLIRPLRDKLYNFISNYLDKLQGISGEDIKKIVARVAMGLVVVNLVIFMGTCRQINQQANGILGDWTDNSQEGQIELLESAIQNGQKLKNINWINSLPSWLNPIETSSVLALQKINDEINEKNRFQYSDRENITAIASFPNSKKIVTGGNKGTLRIWDSSIESDENRKLCQETEFCKETDQAPIKSLSVSLEGEMIATGGENGSVNVWNAFDKGDFGLLYTLKCKDEQSGSDLTVESLTFGRDIQDYGSKNYYLAAGSSEGDVCIWRVSHQDKNPKSFPPINLGRTKDIKKLLFTPDNKIIAMATDDGVIEFRALQALEATNDTNSESQEIAPIKIKPYDGLPGEKAYLKDFNFNADGTQIITAGQNPKVRVWEWQTYQQGDPPLHEWDVYGDSENNSFISVSFGFDRFDNRPMAIVGNNRKLTFLELKSDQACQKAFEKKENCPQPQELKANETNKVIYASFETSTQKIDLITMLENGTSARTWQVNRKSPFLQKELSLQDNQASIKSMEIRHKRQGQQQQYYIISLTENSKVETWSNTSNNDITRDTESDPFLNKESWSYASIKFLPDEKRWATISNQGLIELWDKNPGDPPEKIIDIKQDNENEIDVNQIAFSPNNNLVAVAVQTKEVRFRNYASPDKEIGSIDASDHGTKIEFMSFSKDGKYLLLAGGNHGSIWDVSDSKNIDKILPSDGEYFTLQDSPSDSDPTKLNIEGKISKIGFTPTGNVAIATTTENKIFLWDTSAKELKHFDFELDFDAIGIIQPTEGIDDFSFSRNRPLLAIVFHHNNIPIIQVWDWNKKQPLAQLKSSLKKIKTVKLNPEGDLIVVGGERRENGPPGEVFKLNNLDELLKESCSSLKDYHNIHQSRVKVICQSYLS